jgi:formate hydrogenlyase subunit 6/NADH:ubiquinone oxidoreductase subunit I/flavodoxin
VFEAVNVEIYFFSGTGNSLVAARDIARILDGNLVSIAAAIKHEIVEPQSDVLGIVFPVFYATNDRGIPLIVERFIKKLKNLGSKYIFAVCTCGYMPGMTIENLSKTIESQNGKLAAGFTLRMSSKKLSERKQQEERFKRIKKIENICQYVKAQKKGKFETRGLFRKIFLAPLREFEKPIFMRRYRKLSNTLKKSFKEYIPLADASFRINENCTGCGICARICPVNNIKMIEGKPKWLHYCETCYSCYGWCPNKAICGDIVEYNDWYHHPEVELAEILRMKGI